MGFWNAMQSIGRKAWGVGKKAVGFVSDVIHKIAQAGNFIEDLLNKAEDFPIIGDIAKTIKDDELYQYVQGGISEAEGMVNVVEHVGGVRAPPGQQIRPLPFPIRPAEISFPGGQAP